MENKDMSAYPIYLQEGLSHNSHVDVGLTKRELIAAMAMQGLLANKEGVHSINDCTDPVKLAVFYTDELLKQLSQ